MLKNFVQTIAEPKGNSVARPFQQTIDSKMHLGQNSTVKIHKVKNMNDTRSNVEKNRKKRNLWSRMNV